MKEQFEYAHTQIGWVMIVSLLAAFSFVPLAYFGGDTGAAIFLASVLFASVLLFASLTVRLSKDCIYVVFGIGVIRMRIKLDDVAAIGVVSNKWWYGYGIHGWWRKGWLLNVSGLDAVELKLKNGMVYRIGTDEPAKLHAAIQGNMKTNPPRIKK